MAFKYETQTLPIPLGGLNTRDEPTIMNRLQTPSMQNMEVDRSLIQKRLGYSLFGTWLPLTGTGMELIQYTDGPGTNHHIALTTSHAYEYNSSTDIWDVITPSTLLENCDDVWAGGSGDTIASETTIKVRGSASAKVTLTAERSADDELQAEDISSTNITAHTHIGFWIRSNTAIPAGDISIVVSEDNIATGLISAVEGTDYVRATIPTTLVADTWTHFSVAKTLTNLNAVIAVGLYADDTLASGVIVYVDDVRAYTEFTGGDSDRWSHTIASNLSEFTANGGSALVISNGVDGPFAFEGTTGESFAALSVSSEFTSFNFTQEIEDFWNHLWLFNYDDNGVNFARNAAFHDVSTGAYNGLGITENILTDSRGQIRRAKKLGYDMVLYSDNSITICRRVGGVTLFILPTVIYESGLLAEKGVWDSVNQHFFLGTDQKIYAYTGGTQLIPIGLLVEQQFFSDIDSSKVDFIVTGLDPVKHKIYFFYATVSNDYAKDYLAYNWDKNPTSWEQGVFADTIADFSIFDNQLTWACDGPQVAGKTCDAAEFVTTKCSDGSILSGFPQTTFLSRDGNVFRFTTSASNDNGTDIEAWYTTPDLIPVEGRTDEEGRFAGFNFSAKSDIANSTVVVSYSTDGGATFTTMDTVSLQSSWTQHRVPGDVKAKKIRYKIYQNSSGDFKIRSQSYKVQLATDR